jgi:hypothetical protein
MYIHTYILTEYEGGGTVWQMVLRDWASSRPLPKKKTVVYQKKTVWQWYCGTLASSRHLLEQSLGAA